MKNDAVWVQLDPESLNDAQRDAYDVYRRFRKQAGEAKGRFEATMQGDVPEGQRMIFGYNFGKLSVAVVENDRKPAKAKQAAMPLAQYLATMAAGGHAS